MRQRSQTQVPKSVLVETANREQRASRLIFDEGALQTQVGDMAPVDVKTVLLPPPVCKLFDLPKTVAQSSA